MTFKVWHVAAIHTDASTWSTQVSGVNRTSADAQDVLTRHIAERIAQGQPRVTACVLANNAGGQYSTTYTVNVDTGVMKSVR